ncbi:MAG: bifunctional folylpolyglutamate synthase/dihydrofolate synthase [Proteobacteria bacterium]|nr:MAG: bifunctional folylpolyglutamate synthase/dihydrofolate synthase [Pseudomonadota bacterium]
MSETALPRGLAALATRRRFGVDLSLDRMRELLRVLGEPLADLPLIHVAGTNGKGSTAALLAAALTAGGYRVGLYTSPHLQRFNERIVIDGAEIDDDVLERCLDRVLALAPLATFFEVATATAFLAFAEASLDACVVETGLGGRLDATNVIRPQLSVLTPIALDHRAVLGESLESIAGEKAGIIKPQVPCVAAGGTPEVERLFARVCWEREAPLWLEGREIEWSADDWGRLAVSTPAGRAAAIEIGLAGGHQRQNAALAWAALDLAGGRGLAVEPEARRRGFAEVRWPGRLERLSGCLLDCAHNLAASRALAEALPQNEDHVLVFAALADKDPASMLAALRPRVGRALFPQLQSERARRPAQLAALWGDDAEIFPHVEAALAAARADPRPTVVSGSAYLVGEARALLEGKASPQLGDPPAAAGVG